MPLVSCPHCGKSGNAPGQLMGKRIKCRQCATPFVAQPGKPQESVSRSIDEDTDLSKIADLPVTKDEFPESVALESVAFPCRVADGVLHVAVVDPSNVELRDRLQFIVNREIVLEEASREAILAAIARCYARDSPAEQAPSMPSGSAKRGFFARLFGGEDRSDWEVLQYAQAIADRVTDKRSGQDSGLEAQRKYVCALGAELNAKFGFEGMQQAWYAINRSLGPGPCSDLTRIWDGIGRWQK